jgi:dolichol-phosphate mannosyltransferase
MVVPTYNESANLPELAQRFFDEKERNPGLELLIVDDRSPDGTGEVCRELQSRFAGLHLLERDGPRGLGRAYLAGLRWGLERGYDVVGTMDADLSHDPRHLPAMVARLQDADVVIGSRYVRDGGTVNWRLRRIVLSWLANRFAAFLLGVPVHDMTSGYRLYRAAALRRIGLDGITSTGYSFLAELLFLLYRSGARLAESPILFVDRTLGKSKLGSREIYLGALHLMRMRFFVHR